MPLHTMPVDAARADRRPVAIVQRSSPPAPTAGRSTAIFQDRDAVTHTELDVQRRRQHSDFGLLSAGEPGRRRRSAAALDWPCVPTGDWRQPVCLAAELRRSGSPRWPESAALRGRGGCAVAALAAFSAFTACIGCPRAGALQRVRQAARLSAFVAWATPDGFVPGELLVRHF